MSSEWIPDIHSCLESLFSVGWRLDRKQSSSLQHPREPGTKATQHLKIRKFHRGSCWEREISNTLLRRGKPINSVSLGSFYRSLIFWVEEMLWNRWHFYSTAYLGDMLWDSVLERILSMWVLGVLFRSPSGDSPWFTRSMWAFLVI